MASVHPIPRNPQPLELHTHAMDNLRFIRETMERAASFTAVPGWGGLVIGITALAAALLASTQSSANGWLAVWLMEGLIAIVIGALAMHRKAKAAQVPLFSGPTRRFALSFTPPLVVGGLITAVLYRANLVAALPGMWLLLYGTGVVTG